MGLVQRSISSSAYNIVANTLSMAINFASTIVLARLLAPEIFGVYAFASSIVNLTRTIPNFGALGAFMHHPNASEDEEACKTHFTLTALFSALWVLLLGSAMLIFAEPSTHLAFAVILSSFFISQLTNTPQAILTRRVQFRRMAVMQLAIALATTVVSVGLAWYGWRLWSLLVTDIISAILNVIILYGIQPVWTPRFGWHPSLVRYFLSFGRKIFTGSVLTQVLDQLDDVWTGAVLGNTALGYYNRAYKFATYPRRALAVPLNKVMVGTFAQLSEDRQALSKAFSWVMILMIRVNFLFAGLLTLIAPEFIRLVIGPKWLPMLTTFRLMLVYTLLDPIKLIIAFLINNAGAPEKTIRVRFIQLVVMIAGLVTLGPWLGIDGVALAVDLMLIVGIGLFFWEARAFVDFSLKRIFTVPVVALICSMGGAFIAVSLPNVAQSDWLSGIIKLVGGALLYIGVILVLEREQIPVVLSFAKRLWSRKSGTLV